MHQMAFKSSLIPSLTMQRARALFIKDLASYSILLLSLTCFCPLFFTSPSTSSFIFFSIAIIFHSLYTLTLLSFFAPLPDFFHPYLCFNLLIHCVCSLCLPNRCFCYRRPEPVHHSGCVHCWGNCSPLLPGDLLHC